MIIPLINCPSWHLDSPPYNLALLKAVLAQRGVDSICLDLNLHFYKQISDDIEKQSWLPMQQGSCWERREFAIKIFEKYIDFIQDYILKIISLNPEVICFTVNNRNRYFTYLTADKLKKMIPEKKIIFGGPACFRLVDPNIHILSQSCADAVCLGEGEISFVNLLRIIDDIGTLAYCPGFAYKSEEGIIVDCGEGPIVEDLNLLPFADYSDFDITKYSRKRLSILTSKSCNNRCSFCSERPRMRKYRVRNFENVYSEILYQLSKYPYIESFQFNDSLINGDISMLDALCSLLIKGDIKIRWEGQATIKESMSLELLEKMKRAGCETLSYGVESGSDKVLSLMQKGYNTILAERVLKNTYEAGIGFNLNIIVGFPGETEKEFQETVNFVRRNMKYAKTVTLNTLNFQEGSDLSLNPYKWNIAVNKEDSVSGWMTLDGKNNYQERLRRLSILREIVGQRSSIASDKKVDFYFDQGNRLLKKGKKDEALEFYLVARRINKDAKMMNIIEDKITMMTELKENIHKNVI